MHIDTLMHFIESY